MSDFEIRLVLKISIEGEYKIFPSLIHDSTSLILRDSSLVKIRFTFQRNVFHEWERIIRFIMLFKS